MVLHAESLLPFHPNTFNTVVVEINMGNLYLRVIFNRFRVYSEPMVLGCNFALACNQIFHRVIEPPVSMMHFISWNSVSKSEQLVSQTNPKHRFIFLQYF